ncbi:MAG: hypothetical protein CBC48_05790 [bacterium TMED88]|nr:hypothetical protein [Deltaproteobacteria bacterium]OUV34484.1 MAG: hypothetical protein CBC48_05790 [bacterium TMED88]
MPTFVRFLLFECLSWGVTAFVLAILVHLEWIPLWLGCVVFAVLVIKDLALYPLTRKAHEIGHPHGGSALLGREVRAETVLDPEGWVRAGPERWRARVAETEKKRIIEPGHGARVLQLEGLVLIVEPIESGSS